MANVHLDATEHEDHVVFLHQIQEGPANRSFGLQVARLAGVPAGVLTTARAKLQALESGQDAGPPPAQNELFAAPEPPAPSPVIEQLRALNPDDMTARQALACLYELKQNLGDEP